MLYLEDYIELVEILPQELRDRLTEMRLLDLQSQNSLDQLQHKVNNFFQLANTLSPEQRQREYEGLLQEYNKPLVDSEEKINLTTQIEDFLHKYTRKLEQDIQKFKLELEADNSGITEILEKRVSESQQKENQRSSLLAARNKLNNSVPHSSAVRSAEPAMPSASSVPPACNNSVNYSLSNIGAGGMAITAAASQAIAATQQMKQGRRTASLKASYEAIHGASSSSTELSLVSRELAGAAQSAIAASQEGSNKKNKKKSTASSQGAKGQGALANLSMGTINMSNTSSALHSLMMETSTQHSKHHSSALAGSSSDSAAQAAAVATTGEEETAYGADEPRYCQCNEVAFGVMVACDSKNCPYEWYHCECVGIAPDNPPKGKWYCPLCTEKMKQYSSSGGSRKHRKN